MYHARIKHPLTNYRINDLKNFMSKNKKAEVYEPSERYKEIDGYLVAPLQMQNKLKYAAQAANLPIYIHQFDGVIVLIRTDM